MVTILMLKNRTMNRQQKRAAMKEVALLTDTIGWESDPEIVSRVESLGKIVGGETVGVSKPLPELEFGKLTTDTFLYLRTLGYLVHEIRDACGVSNTMMQSWIRNNELTRKHINFDEIADWEFSEQAKKMPLKGAEVMYVITKEKINEFLQDGGWSSSTQTSYRSLLNIFSKYMNGKEITTKKIDAFLFSYISNETPTKRSNVKSVLLKYLKWIDFEYDQREERAIDVYNEKIENLLPAAAKKSEPRTPSPEKVALLLNESEKTCVKVGKGFMVIDLREKNVSISLDYLEATDLSEKKEQALKIAEEFGGQIVKIQTRTILVEAE